jgi:cytochrome P450
MVAIPEQNTRIPWDIPGPDPLPIVGPIGNLAVWGMNPLRRLSEMFQKYGQIITLSRGGGTRLMTPWKNCPGTLFAYGPELNREVLTQTEIYYKSALSGRAYPVGNVSPRQEPLLRWGTGLFSVNGEEHRQHRRLLMPAFHKKRIEAYRDDMVAIAQETLDSWKAGEQRDIHHDMMQLTLRVATKTLFGDDLAADASRVLDVFHEMFRLVTEPSAIILQRDIPGIPYHRLLDLAGQFDQDMREIVQRKRANGANGGDVLSMLVQTRDEDGTMLTEDELMGHVGVIFAAGHETSSNALTWTLFLLSQHLQITEALVQELRSVLNGAAPTVEHLNELPMLERVIKESMRMLPPVPFNHRIVAVDTKLGGYHIPAGTELLMSIYHTHHMAELFPEPERFNPDRWLTIDPSPFEYNPFSAGPRMCIGATFAMMEIKIVLAMLLQRYGLDLVSGTRVEPNIGITMRPKHGMPMQVHARNETYSPQVGKATGTIRELVTLP